MALLHRALIKVPRRAWWRAVAASAFLISACTPAANPTGESLLAGELRVFAASSLTDAFGELAQQFQQANPGARVTLTFGGTPQLRTQIEQGARADVFASANLEQMDLAVKNEVVAGGASRPFAQNRLLVIVPRANPAAIERPADLARSGVKLILTPKEVPVGAYAREALMKMSLDPAYGPSFADRVLRNVVSEESNVRLVVTKVQLGEADAGIVYATDLPPQIESAVRQVLIPDKFNVLASYPIAVVRDTRQRALAEAFVGYVLSPAGQAVLRRHGFQTP